MSRKSLSLVLALTLFSPSYSRTARADDTKAIFPEGKSFTGKVTNVDRTSFADNSKDGIGVSVNKAELTLEDGTTKSIYFHQDLLDAFGVAEVRRQVGRLPQLSQVC